MAATGERIVAFGRAGKRPENPFLWAFAADPEDGGGSKRRVACNGF
jgi:hypothetical protein